MEPPVALPVCGAATVPDARPMDVRAGDAVCPACDTYLREVYLVQTG